MNWLRQKWAWANRNRLFWAHVLLILLSALVIVYWRPVLTTGPSDLPVRLWGTLLQLLGVITVWTDLTKTARQFGKDGFLGRTVEWLQELLRGRRVVLGTVMGAMAGLVGKARATVRYPAVPTAPLFHRVAALEKNFAEIDKELTQAFQEMQTSANDIEAKLSAERGERERAIQEIRRDVEEATTGSYAVLAFGAIWLGVGIVLASLAPEIAKLVAGEWRDVWQALVP